jgi:glutamate-1-semialdehyde 2,1-aminomutase
MAEKSLELRDVDRRVWEEELADFVPERVFDVHTHIYNMRMKSAEPEKEQKLEGTWADWPLSNRAALEEVDKLLLPNREVHRISFGNPLQSVSLDEANAFVAREVAGDDKSAALMLVRPEMKPSEIKSAIDRYGFRGFKPYRMHSTTGDVAECRITDFLPEEQIEVADSLGLVVMLHISKSLAIADPENLVDLERLTSRYPKVKWILAHCARSYFDHPLISAADRLREMPNLWYEISSVCDTDAMDVLLTLAGPNRVMYGSDDLPVGVTRGKYITFGYAWAELNELNQNLNLSHCSSGMTFIRYESLRAFRRACRRHGFGKREIDRLFRGNAEELLGWNEKDEMGIKR